MSEHVDTFAPTLRLLRAEIGDIEFGYRAQALFAHVLQRIGVKVVEIRHQGHPDIIGNLGGHLGRFEVEIAAVQSRDHTIKGDDLSSITPSNENDVGFLAVLDGAYPVRWAVIEHSRIQKRLGRWPLTTIHAIADVELSSQCTAAFRDILTETSANLHRLTFHLLCSRVPEGHEP